MNETRDRRSGETDLPSPKARDDAASRVAGDASPRIGLREFAPPVVHRHRPRADYRGSNCVMAEQVLERVGAGRVPGAPGERLPAGVGNQVVLDLYDCATDRLDDVEWVCATMTEAARIAGATIVDSIFHRFSPWGISGVVVISESHLAVHIWPEHRYAAVDFFTCGDSVDLERAVGFLASAFEAPRADTFRVDRGTNIR